MCIFFRELRILGSSFPFCVGMCTVCEFVKRTEAQVQFTKKSFAAIDVVLYYQI